MATPIVCNPWNAEFPAPWSQWLQMRRRIWLKTSGKLAWASRLASTWAISDVLEEEGRAATIAFTTTFRRGRSQPRILASAAKPLVHRTSLISKMSARARFILPMSSCTIPLPNFAIVDLKEMATTRPTLHKSIVMQLRWYGLNISVINGSIILADLTLSSVGCRRRTMGGRDKQQIRYEKASATCHWTIHPIDEGVTCLGVFNA